LTILPFFGYWWYTLVKSDELTKVSL